jgi:endoglucanase
MRRLRPSSSVAPLPLIAVLGACGSYQPKDESPAVNDGGVPQNAAPVCADRGNPDAGNQGGDWLYTNCNAIRRSDGKTWMARGANLPDTRGCDACTHDAAPNVDEVFRRIDALTDGWGATFIRLDLEAYPASGGRAQWKSVVDDPQYLADVQRIVAYAAKKPGVYVLLSPWLDPTQDAQGWPTGQTRTLLAVLAEAFKDQPRVMFAVASQPHDNLDGSQDPQAWAAMNDAVAAVRATEQRLGSKQHLVAVPGLGSWGRRLDWLVTHPIQAGGGRNVVYQVNAWDRAAAFKERFEDAARTLPVIIGEFGPATVYGSTMGEDDARALMERAEALSIPWLAWTFHMRCPPNLLEDLSTRACGGGMNLQPTAWGGMVKAQLAKGRAGGTP